MDDQNNGQQTPEPAGNEPTDNGTQDPQPADGGNGQDDAAELERLRKTNAQLHARATKAEAELKRRPERTAAPGAHAELPPGVATIDDTDHAILTAKGYSDDEIDSLRILAKGTGKRLKDVASMKEAQAIIEAKRKEKQSGDATPPPSSRPTTTKPGQKAYGQMTEDERRANFGQLVDKHSRRGNSSAR